MKIFAFIIYILGCLGIAVGLSWIDLTVKEWEWWFLDVVLVTCWMMICSAIYDKTA